MTKQARWARLTVIEALDFRHRLGYPADSHRIDPRSFERPAKTATAEFGDARLCAGDVAEAA